MGFSDKLNGMVIDTPPMGGENKKLTSFRLSEELKTVLERAAEEKGVTMTELVEIGAEIMSFLPLQVWDTLKYNERRTQRQLSPAQQIVDVLCFKYSAPLMKWGRDNKDYLSRIAGEVKS